MDNLSLLNKVFKGMDAANITHEIILFDGVCNLCNGTVQFVIKRDESGRFRFASLQSEFGKQVIDKFKIPANLSTFILIEEARIYKKSTAALRVARKLVFPWKLLFAFILIPRFIRDAVYNYVARNRFKFFGKRENCWIPSADLKHLFIEWISASTLATDFQPDFLNSLFQTP